MERRCRHSLTPVRAAEAAPTPQRYGVGSVAVGADSSAQPIPAQPKHPMDQPPKQFAPGYNALLRGRRSEPGRAYMITTVTEKRVPIFGDIFLARLVVHEMMNMENEGLVHSLAFVLMPDHLHWLLVLQQNEDLSHVVGLLKGRSARRVNKRLDRRGPVWQRAFYDHAIRKDEDVRKTGSIYCRQPDPGGDREKDRGLSTVGCGLAGAVVQMNPHLPCWISEIVFFGYFSVGISLCRCGFSRTTGMRRPGWRFLCE